GSPWTCPCIQTPGLRPPRCPRRPARPQAGPGAPAPRPPTPPGETKRRPAVKGRNPVSQPGERQRQPQPAARPGPRLAFPSGWGWWAKLVFVAVLDALVIPFVITLFRDQQYAFFASVVVG